MLTPLVAAPEVIPGAAGEIVASVGPASVDPLAGLDVLDVTSPVGLVAPAPDASGPQTPQAGGDWMSPEGALRGEFGELVEQIPQRPTAQAPVFPTPPAPWPAVATGPGGVSAVDDDSTLRGLDAGFEDVLGTRASSSAIDERETKSDEAAALDELGGWTAAESDRATPAEVSSIPGTLDVSATEGEVWADAYEAQADAIHGALESDTTASGPSASAASAGRVSDWWEAEASGAEANAAAPESASYLATEWPELPPAADPSTLPTPVISSPAITASWSAGHVNDVPRDAELERAGHGEEATEWPGDHAPTDGAESNLVGGQALEDWSFTADASADTSGRATPTTSSLAAAEALEQIAAQLRSGALRADGYSPALGEAAALSAVLAALLGVDARWDVR